MAIIITLNVVFIALVVGGILTLLSWGIASDRRAAPALGATQSVARRRSTPGVGASLRSAA